MVLLIVFALVSIIFSFLCSIWEAVLLSISPSYVSMQEEENPSLGRSLKYFKSDIDRPLSAILTLNTIAHTVGAIMVGVQAGKLYGQNYFSLLGFQLSYETIVAVLMTLAILYLSEIIPKTIGASNWKALAPFTVKCVQFLILILTPLIWVSMMITKRFKSAHGGSVLSRADFLAMTSLSEKSGAIQLEESTIIKNLLDLDKVKVKDVMTPSTVVFTLSEMTSMQGYYDTKRGKQYSRIPVFDGDNTHITGFVLKDEILQEIIEGNKEKALKSIRRPITHIEEEISLRDFFIKMKQENNHVAMVTDEFGAMDGIVTLEDLVETILGYEIIDETDDVADLQAYARKQWEQRKSQE